MKNFKEQISILHLYLRRSGDFGRDTIQIALKLIEQSKISRQKRENYM